MTMWILAVIPEPAAAGSCDALRTLIFKHGHGSESDLAGSFLPLALRIERVCPNFYQKGGKA